MTREEAVNYLERSMAIGEDDDSGYHNEVLEFIIKVLEQEPCEDAVSRKTVLQMIEDIQDAGGFIGYNTYSEAFDQVDNMPSVTPTQRWIPCSEGLPKENVWDDGYVEPSDYVLVFGDCGEYGVSRYWGNRKSKAENPNSYKDWMDLDWIAQKPIAWMPLPNGYVPDKNVGKMEETLSYADQDTMQPAT